MNTWDQPNSGSSEREKREVAAVLSNVLMSPVASGRTFSLQKKPESHHEALSLLESVLSDPVVGQ